MAAPLQPTIYATSYNGLSATLNWSTTYDTEYSAVWTEWDNRYYYPSSGTYTVTLPSYGTTYHYQVANVNSAGEYSAWSWYSDGSLLAVQDIPRPSAPWGIWKSYNGLTATIYWSKDSYTTKTSIWTEWDGRYYESYGSSINVTLPSANTTYYVQLQAINSEGEVLAWTSKYDCALYVQDIPRPGVPYNITASYSGTTATIRWSNDAYAVKTSIWTEWNNTYYSTTGTSYNITLPSKGTTYYFQLQAINAEDEVSAWSDKYSCPLYVAALPKPGLPYNIQVSYSGMTATVTWTKGSNSTSTSLWSSWDNMYYSTTGTSYSFAVPNKGVSYNVQLQAVNADWLSEWTPSTSCPIFISSRPSNFTNSLYKVVNSEDRIDTANWIAFANRVNEFRVYKGYSNYDFILTRGSATVGNTFTASIFNEMLSAMGTICTGLPSQKTTGDAVYKSYFDTMVTRLNSVT